MADDAERAEEQVEDLPQIDLSEVRVEGLMLQVASELMSIGAGQLGMIPEMVNGGDAFQASLAIAGADALVETFVGALPEGMAVPQPVEELRGALADLKLAFADAVRAASAGQAPAAAEGAQPPAEPEAERPAIWTPRGDV